MRSGHDIINEILRREGGFVDHPADRGGPTNYGITMATLSQWRGRQVTTDEVRNLTESEARRIYLQEYLIRPGFNRLTNPKLQALVVDCGVNHGVSRAAKWLQRALGVTEDGVLGPVTLTAAQEASARLIYARVLATRARFYGRIITDDPQQAAFAAGWAHRLAEFIEDVADA